MGTEIKDDFDSTLFSFSMECSMHRNLSSSDYAFLVFYKQKVSGSFQPIFKTECKTHKMTKFIFNTTTLGTDTMFGGHDDQPCLVKAFQFK